MGYKDNCIDDGWTIYREKRQLVMAAFLGFFSILCIAKRVTVRRAAEL